MTNPYAPEPQQPKEDLAATIAKGAATRRASSKAYAAQTRKDAILLAAFAAGTLAVIVGIIYWIIGANVDDHDAAVALNKHINSMGQDFAGYSNYQGTQPDGGKGAVAIQTSLYDKPENEQSAEYMCSSLTFTRADIPDVKHVRVLSSADTTLARCY